MKADRARIESALRAPGDTRFFLLHGPDEAGSRSLLKRLAAAMGDDAERVDLSGADLRADPARLADEAAAISMFGDKRWIQVEQAGDEILPALEALIESPGAGNPVAIVAGALKPSSKLLKLALAEKGALAFASYLPNARDADRLVSELARGFGLVVPGDVARRIAEGAGGNRAVIEQELAKYALYADAVPDRPQPLDHDMVDALGADTGEGDLGRLVDAVIGGDAGQLEAELSRLRAQGQEGISLIRAVLRRLVVAARLRAEVEQGSSVASVIGSAGKSLFFKEKDAIERMIGRWRSDLIAKAISRLAEAERQVMAPGGPGLVAADAELFAICRQAARLRQ